MKPKLKTTILAAAALSWSLAAADAVVGAHHMALFNLNMAVALLSATWLIFCRRSRPVDIAFDLGFERGQRLGYEAGHRDALRETGHCLCAGTEAPSTSEAQPIHRAQVTLRQVGLNGGAQEPCPYRSQDQSVGLIVVGDLDPRVAPDNAR